MRESTRKERQALKTLRKNQSDLEANRARCVTQRKAIAPEISMRPASNKQKLMQQMQAQWRRRRETSRPILAISGRTFDVLMAV